MNRLRVPSASSSSCSRSRAAHEPAANAPRLPPALDRRDDQPLRQRDLVGGAAAGRDFDAEATTFEVGLLTAAAWAPWLLIGLPVGAWVDRVRRRPLMLASSAISGLLLAVVPLAPAQPADNRVSPGPRGPRRRRVGRLPDRLHRLSPDASGSGRSRRGQRETARQRVGRADRGTRMWRALVQFAGAANALLVDARQLPGRPRLSRRDPLPRTHARTHLSGPARSGRASGWSRGDVWLRTLTIFGARLEPRPDGLPVDRRRVPGPRGRTRPPARSAP